MLFWKYQGAGNDFVMVDQREAQWLGRSDTERIAQICDRHFGIGADGLILLQQRAGYDFEMIYFNADGRESSMCGNGGRCIAAFARQLGIIGDQCTFLAIDGQHEALFTSSDRLLGPGEEWVELHMQNVQTVEKQGDAFVLNTGSPHYVRFADEIDSLDMVREGRAVRYSDTFREKGINVNLVRSRPAGFDIRTYERGVEDETLACGTGVTASAIAWFLQKGIPAVGQRVEVGPIQARGGVLSVHFHAQADGSFTDIWLCGPAQRVFSGEIGQ